MNLQQMREINRKLERLGFLEVKDKRFLFRKNFYYQHDGKEHLVIFFADMRAKLYHSYYYKDLPFCYTWDPEETVPSWLEQRIDRQQCEILEHEGIRTHLEDTLYIDGICKICGVDFKDDACYCPSCEQKRRLEKIERIRKVYDAISDVCFCGVKLTRDSNLLNKIIKYEIGPIKKLIPHHTSYKPEVTMPVCQSCHARIELSIDPEFTKYRAKDKKPKKIRKTVDVICASCRNKMRVPREKFEYGQSYECLSCTRKTERRKIARARPKKLTWYERKALEAKFERYKGKLTFE